MTCMYISLTIMGLTQQYLKTNYQARALQPHLLSKPGWRKGQLYDYDVSCIWPKHLPTGEDVAKIATRDNEAYCSRAIVARGAVKGEVRVKVVHNLSEYPLDGSDQHYLIRTTWWDWQPSWSNWPLQACGFCSSQHLRTELWLYPDNRRMNLLRWCYARLNQV